MATIITILCVLALVASGVFFLVHAYQRTKNPEKWDKLLDDAGVKLD